MSSDNFDHILHKVVDNNLYPDFDRRGSTTSSRISIENNSIMGDKMENNFNTLSTLDASGNDDNKKTVQFTIGNKISRKLVENTRSLPTDDSMPALKTHLTSFLSVNNQTPRNYSYSSSIGSLNEEMGETFESQHARWLNDSRVRAWLVALLSALYALVLVIMSLAFEISTLVVGRVTTANYNVFYIYLYLVGLSFLAYCQIFLLRTTNTRTWKFPWLQKRPSSAALDNALEAAVRATAGQPLVRTKNVSHSAENAGSLYLRLGAVVFGIVGLIDHGLQLFRAFDSGEVSTCYNTVGIIEDVLFIVFIFIQLYFVFQNSKMVIRRFKHIGRFGMMHLVATNMCIWIRGIVSELLHVMHEIEHSLHQQNKPHVGANHSNADHDHKGFETRELACFSLQKGMDDLLGNVKPFMTTCLVEYSLICAAVTFILWRNIGRKSRKKSKIHRNNVHVDCSSSTKGLFVGLIFLTFVIISMCVFFTKIQQTETDEALWVLQFSDLTLYSFAILAMALGFYRMQELTYMPQINKESMLDDILLIVGLIGQLMFCIFSMAALDRTDDLTSTMIVCVSLLRMVQVLLQTVFILCAQRMIALTPETQSEKPGREIITFLLLCNVAMFLINTFETQKASANSLTTNFYGESTWMMIVYGTVPLTIFYRFHSSVCFAEVWKVSYRVKKGNDM